MLTPRFTITSRITAGLTQIERALGFLEGAKLSEDSLEKMRSRVLLLEAHHTTHIEGTRPSKSRTMSSSAQLPTGEPFGYADLRGITGKRRCEGYSCDL